MSEVVQKELPEKWEWSTLGEVCEKPQYGWTTKASQKGDLHLLRTTDITSGKVNWDTVPYCVIEPEDKEKYRINDGDIVVSRAGSVGVSYLISNPEPSVFASYLIRFKPLIDRKYVYFFLKSPAYWNAISEKSAGIALQNVNASKLKEIHIPVAPPEQQKRIVAKIEQLFSHIDTGIEALKKAKQLLKQYRQSVLKAAVTGELTKEWREANNRSFDNWQESTIGEIAKVQTGKTPKRTTEEFWKSGTIPWLTSSATNEAFTHHADQFVTQLAVDNGLKLFESGTLLLAMYGEGKTRGQVTEITFQATCNQACAAIIVDKDKASCAFVRLRLNENYEQIRKAASGGNQPNLNLSKVREISLPLPPLTEQAEIVFQVELKFEAVNRLEKDLETQLFKAEKNKQSILASAFQGKMTLRKGLDDGF